MNPEDNDFRRVLCVFCASVDSPICLEVEVGEVRGTQVVAICNFTAICR